MKDYIKKLISILKGELKYEQKREFTTSEDYNKANRIEQRGDDNIMQEIFLKWLVLE